MLGDWHDNRHALGVSTILASLDGMDLLNASFKRVWWLPGNHDLLYRGRRDAASIEFARWLPNVEIIRQPLTCDDCTFLPWLVGDEHQSLDLQGRYVFAHAEIAGFLRNAKSVMPGSAHTATAEQFVGPELVLATSTSDRPRRTSATSATSSRSISLTMATRIVV